MCGVKLSEQKSWELLSDYVESLIDGADDADVLAFPPLYSIRDWAKQLEAEKAKLKRVRDVAMRGIRQGTGYYRFEQEDCKELWDALADAQEGG